MWITAGNGIYATYGVQAASPHNPNILRYVFLGWAASDEVDYTASSHLRSCRSAPIHEGHWFEIEDLESIHCVAHVVRSNYWIHPSIVENP